MDVQHQVSFKLIDAGSTTARPKMEFYYRILTASRQIKYLTFTPLKNAPLKHALPDYHGEQLDIETVPEGIWTVGYLILKDGADKFTLGSTANVSLSRVEQIWCPRTISYLELTPTYDRNALQLIGKMRAMVCDGFFGVDEVLAHFEWDPNSIYPIDCYTDILFQIDGHGIGPKFLAHVTENDDRVIGYIVERVHGRYATHADLGSCRAVLSKLHDLGLLHGMLNAQSFIVSEDGRTMLHEFGACFKPDDPSLLVAEMAGLEEALNKQPYRLEPLSKELSDQAIAILERDGGMHPEILLKGQKERQFDITEVEHRKMLEEFDSDTFRFQD